MCPLTELCPGTMLLAGVKGEGTRTSVDGTEWWSVTADIMARDEALEFIDGCVAAIASKHAGRGVVSSETCEMSSRSSNRLSCWFRLDHQRMAKSVMVVPIAMPPSTPPAIAPALMEVLVLCAFVTELVCATYSLLVAPGVPTVIELPLRSDV